MSYVVYWLERGPIETVARFRGFGDLEMTAALSFMQGLRNDGASHVTFSSENPNSVGKPGVDSIVDGKTPDGHDYDWTKRRGDPRP